ncbi:MAG: cupredoxin domain-containing protein [Myxococcales bacterium]|nr:cupredoxin domain-containing protein [Myxococcales bacterium]
MSTRRHVISVLLPLLALGLLACGGEDAPEPTRIAIEVGSSGYTPSEVHATRGEPVTLVFTRTTEEGCGEVLVIASEDIRRDLPLNEPVEVTFTPSQSGHLRFSCGMDMYDGTIVVE